MSMPPCDVAVVGAGAVGAACAYFAARAGHRVTVVDRGAIASGTSSACEGNILVSDKKACPELDLALYSHRVWLKNLAEYGKMWEFEAKGALVVAATERGFAAESELIARHRARGITVEDVDAAGLRDLEPHLNPAVTAAAYYPQDAQVQPMLLVAHLLRLARERGAHVLTGAEVTGFLRERDRVVGVRTSSGDLPAGAVVNAAGTWAGEVARLAGVSVPVLPRRGFVLVTEPLPVTVRHKVYAAEYVGDVASSDAALQSLPVVEGGTPACWHHPHRRHPGAGRLPPGVFARGGGAAGPRRGCLVSGARQRAGHAQLPRLPPGLPRSPADHRARPARPGPMARVRPRRRRTGYPPGRDHCWPRPSPGARPPSTSPRSHPTASRRTDEHRDHHVRLPDPCRPGTGRAWPPPSPRRACAPGAPPGEGEQAP